MEFSDIDLETSPLEELDNELSDFYQHNAFKIEIDDYMDYSPENKEFPVQHNQCSGINPDDFINYSELMNMEVKSETQSVTYSPKQSFSESPTSNMQSDGNSPVNLNFQDFGFFETPPISPQQIKTESLPSSKIKVVQVSQLMPSTQNPILIPVPSPQFPKVRTIQPNFVTEPKKTIVIAPKDFQALIASDQTRSKFNQSRTPHIPKPIAAKTSPESSVRSSSYSSDSDSSIKAKIALNSQQKIDPKILKRQERMIKNRESANLSRKKKKDYLLSLETQVTELKKENQTLKTEIFMLKEKLSKYNKFTCKCASSLSQHIPKNAVFLLAVFFMVSINVGSFSNLLLKNSISNQIPLKTNEFPKRSLLFVNDTEESQEINSRLKNFTNSDNTSHGCQTAQEFLNQTENIRLASDLRRWIREPDYQNVSKSYESLEEFNVFLSPLSRKLLSLYEDSKETYWKNLKKNLKKKSKVHSKDNKNKSESKVTKVQLYNPNDNRVKYAEFFEEIGKRDDTFYVVSFNADHLLLPATFYNKSNRPKMSLMLPTFRDNGTLSTEFITLMQIDCEVLNTSLIKVKEKSVPENFKSRQTNTVFNATSYDRNPVRKAERVKRNRTDDYNVSNLNSKIQKNNLKPYFMEKLKANLLNVSNEADYF